jgi:autotransporter-associated beta strand protein
MNLENFEFRPLTRWQCFQLAKYSSFCIHCHIAAMTNNRSTVASGIIFLAALLLAPGRVTAQTTYYLDTDGLSGFGPNQSFVWNTTFAWSWNTDPLGDAATGPWVNGTPANDAVLGKGTGTSSYTGTLGESISVGTISVVTGSWTIALNSNTLTFDSASNSTLAAGISGAGALVKNGSNTLTFGSAVNYTGSTTINGGILSLATTGNTVGSVLVNSSSTLQAGATNALVGSTSLTLGGGAFQISGGAYNQSFSTALKLTASSTIDFGNGLGASAIVFGDSSGQSWTGTLTVSNFDVATDTLRFGSSSSGVSGGQLAAIKFDGVAAQIDANGFITPVPEAAFYGLVAGLGAAWLALFRRRNSRSETAAIPAD